jgi:pimeloyl-ACP methyl ester carboxylesterase
MGSSAIHMHWDGHKPVHLGSADDPVTPDHLTVLIGGLNDAFRQWEGFDRIWNRLKENVVGRQFSAELLYFFWLSSTGRWDKSGLLRYGEFVVRADAAGKALAQYLSGLQQQHPGQRVSLAAHSLGCRVALSTAAHLQNSHPVSDLLMMGSSVPEFECGPRGLYPALATDLSKTTNLWSDKDFSFGFWWRRGEAAALRKTQRCAPPGSREAVGRTGGPAQRWLREPKSCGLLHESYWHEEASLLYVAELVGTAVVKETPTRLLPVTQPPVVREQLSRDERSRTLHERCGLDA